MLIAVVAAVIHDQQGRILIAQRPIHKHQGGLWEFSGGKIDQGETALEALKRELYEELGISVHQARRLTVVEHHYPDKSVRLEVFRVTSFDGIAHGAEGQPICWVEPQALTQYAFPAANVPIVKAACLPSAYSITPERADLLSWLEPRVLAGQWLVLRAKHLNQADYLALAQQVALLCQQRQAHLMLHHYAELITELPHVRGVHFSAQALYQPEVLEKYLAQKQAEHYLAVSTHSLVEMQQAKKYGADFVTLSPVAPTASHPDAQPLGWSLWQNWVEQAELPVFALGGVSHDQLPLVHQLGGQGIAGIRGLWLE